MGIISNYISGQFKTLTNFLTSNSYTKSFTSLFQKAVVPRTVQEAVVPRTVQELEHTKNLLNITSVEVIWGEKHYRIHLNRGSFFKAALNPKYDKAPSVLNPELYGISPKFNDAIIFSLKEDRISQSLKDGGMEAFQDALVFATTYGCSSLLLKLYSHFSKDILFQSDWDIQSVKGLLQFFQKVEVPMSFIKTLLTHAILYRGFQDRVLDIEFSKIFNHPARGEGSLRFIDSWSDDYKKEIVTLLPLLGKDKLQRFLDSNRDNQSDSILRSGSYDFNGNLKGLIDYIQAGGDVELLGCGASDKYYTSCCILQNASALQKFVALGGKINDLNKLHGGVVSYLLENVKVLPQLIKMGFTLDVLYKLDNQYLSALIRYVNKIPDFLENGGSVDDLVNKKINSPAALEYILEFAHQLPFFIKARGKLEDLYTTEKEYNTVLGARVGPLLEYAHKLHLWIAQGGMLQALYNADSRSVRAILMNADKLKNYVQKNESLNALLKLDWQQVETVLG